VKLFGFIFAAEKVLGVIPLEADDSRLSHKLLSDNVESKLRPELLAVATTVTTVGTSVTDSAVLLFAVLEGINSDVGEPAGVCELIDSLDTAALCRLDGELWALVSPSADIVDDCKSSAELTASADEGGTCVVAPTF